MTRFTLYLYTGAMCEPKYIIDEAGIITSEAEDWFCSPEALKAVYALLEKNGFSSDGYFRWAGPCEDGNFHIDFGSYSFFVGMNPVKKER